jgi:hypothetical protein
VNIEDLWDELEAALRLYDGWENAPLLPARATAVIDVARRLHKAYAPKPKITLAEYLEKP